ncbi:uncharacterized protein MONOS_16412p [Monocercomonoides exilis]|nr:hypothetical protein MONOS_16412p [Monocercomonoides exilis]
MLWGCIYLLNWIQICFLCPTLMAPFEEAHTFEQRLRNENFGNFSVLKSTMLQIIENTIQSYHFEVKNGKNANAFLILKEKLNRIEEEEGEIYEKFVEFSKLIKSFSQGTTRYSMRCSELYEWYYPFSLEANHDDEGKIDTWTLWVDSVFTNAIDMKKENDDSSLKSFYVSGFEIEGENCTDTCIVPIEDWIREWANEHLLYIRDPLLRMNEAILRSFCRRPIETFSKPQTLTFFGGTEPTDALKILQQPYVRSASDTKAIRASLTNGADLMPDKRIQSSSTGRVHASMSLADRFAFRSLNIVDSKSIVCFHHPQDYRRLYKLAENSRKSP